MVTTLQLSTTSEPIEARRDTHDSISRNCFRTIPNPSTESHHSKDGGEAVRFLVRVKELVEDPTTLLLEG
jgi:hypothetical protein